MLEALQPSFFRELAGAKRILIAGMGGGFDVFCGLPLYFALRDQGCEVKLANFSFTSFSPLTPHFLTPSLIEVTPQINVQLQEYFPEYYLARWLEIQGETPQVFAFKKRGVQPLLDAYQALIKEFCLDTIILVDGGTDALMRGDESSLGTPHEDAVNLVAVNELKGVQRYMVSLGFGIDDFHGVSHWNVLEATAELARAGAYLGSFSLTADMRPVKLYQDACKAVFEQMPRHISIVNASILSAINGHYGDYHLTERTRGSELWINPLMSQYWCYHLPAVAQRLQYRAELLDTQTLSDVDKVIHTYRAGIEPRARKNLPL